MHLNELDLELESSVGGNHRRRAPLPISHVRGAHQLCHSSLCHERNALLPALDHLWGLYRVAGVYVGVVVGVVCRSSAREM
jgi:hypothetical protein